MVQKNVNPLEIITICGSMRFRDTIKSVYNILTKNGFVVFLPYFGVVDENVDIELLHKIHDTKIEMSDMIFVVDSNDFADMTSYCGKDTNREIEYAKSLNKKIIYLSIINSMARFKHAENLNKVVQAIIK